MIYLPKTLSFRLVLFPYLLAPVLEMSQDVLWQSISLCEWYNKPTDFN